MKRIGLLVLLAGMIAPGARAALPPIVTVDLGAHRFGHTRAPSATVARVGADQVGWQLEGDNPGPETFLVGADRSIWLHDEVNHRLLVWSAGRPNAVTHKTAINFTGYYTPDLVHGDPVIVLDITAGTPGRNWKWEYEVLRLTSRGASVQFSLRRAVFGDNLFADLRVGPDGTLYQLASSPKTGVAIYRYSLGAS